MASLTMMASLSAVVAGVAADRRVAAPRRGGLVVARVAKVECQEPAGKVQAEETRAAEGRRAVMFAAAAAAVSAIGGAAIAGSDVKNGTPEAKKKYAPICVTMPTAKVCHN